MTQTITLAPDQSGYSVTDSSDFHQVELDGGLPRTRMDIIDGARTVEVTWICNGTEFEYIEGFYNDNRVLHGSEEFNIALVLDTVDLTTHLATFVPDSYRLVSQQGETYIVSARLEVKGTALTFGTGGDGDDGDTGNARSTMLPVRSKRNQVPLQMLFASGAWNFYQYRKVRTWQRRG